MNEILSDVTAALDYHGPKTTDAVGYGPENAAARNRLRAYFAAVALKAYGDVVGYDVTETLIGDLIADLRHFAVTCDGDDGSKIDEAAFDELSARASRRWYEEAVLLED